MAVLLPHFLHLPFSPEVSFLQWQHRSMQNYPNNQPSHRKDKRLCSLVEVIETEKTFFPHNSAGPNVQLLSIFGQKIQENAKTNIRLFSDFWCIVCTPKLSLFSSGREGENECVSWSARVCVAIFRPFIGGKVGRGRIKPMSGNKTENLALWMQDEGGVAGMSRNCSSKRMKRHNCG